VQGGIGEFAVALFEEIVDGSADQGGVHASDDAWVREVARGRRPSGPRLRCDPRHSHPRRPTQIRGRSALAGCGRLGRLSAARRT
jgi:hypothetical protein